jgi:hypothetical protein
MTLVRQKLLIWSKITTALILAIVAECSLLGSLALLHRLARHSDASGYAALLPTEHHFAWMWSGRFFVLFFIVSAAFLAHSLARLAQYGCASLRRN